MAPRLTLSIDVEDSATFRTRLANLIIDQGTHIYIDTSFLMWLTKVGSTSRRELTEWFKKYCLAEYTYQYGPPTNISNIMWLTQSYLN